MKAPSNVKIVPATAELMREYYGPSVLPTTRSLILLVDGKPVAVAGAVRGRGREMLLFSDSLPWVREKHKKATLLMARKFFQMVGDKWVLRACADAGVEASARFLEHFGFQQMDDGSYMKCQR